MNVNDRFNLFIAYYGNRTQGSEGAAKTLDDQLNGSTLFRDFTIVPYFHPRTNPHGSFEETPLIVARTPLFLLVVDSGVPVNYAGQLEQHREDGTYRNLFEEVQAFHNSQMYKLRGTAQPAKLFITDGMSFRAAETLHTMFSGHTALHTIEETRRWMADFYLQDWPSRLAKNAKQLFHKDRAAFYEGRWATEAYESWHYSRHTELGQRLLVYCTYRIQQYDDAECLTAGRTIFRELSSSMQSSDPLYRDLRRILKLD